MCNMHSYSLFSFVTIFATLFQGTFQSPYSAVEHLDPLVDIERRVADIMRNYLDENRKTLEKIKPFRNNVEEALYLSTEFPDEYIGNPLNSFYLLKRLAFEWKEVLNTLNKSTPGLKQCFSATECHTVSVDDIGNIYSFNRMYLPSEHVDTTGASKALIRLMDTYGITANQIAEGVLPFVSRSRISFSARDCLDMAQLSHDTQRYDLMKDWVTEAERLMQATSYRPGNTSWEMVYQHMALVREVEADYENASKYWDLVLLENPENEEVLEKKMNFTFQMENNIFIKEAAKVTRRPDIHSREFQTYLSGCRKQDMRIVHVKDITNLRCFYLQLSHPLLYLKPRKVTQLHDSPELFIIHDLFSSSLIDTLKDVSLPLLDVAEVVDLYTQNISNSQHRVSKNVFLTPEDYPEQMKIARQMDPLLEAVTGLSLAEAEDLQVNNYGMAGQFEFHHDHGAPGSVIASDPHGNRMATILLYLSDVDSGGETVFTEIGVSVPPEEGSALFWYNLYRNGTGIFNTRHASCPVIAGSKWVANKWVRERGNEFTRSCALEQLE